LDNAVKQAEERGFSNLLIIDADCHQREPFGLYARYLDQPWKRIFDKSDLSYDREEDPSSQARTKG
jgi:hypothetical protein